MTRQTTDARASSGEAVTVVDPVSPVEIAELLDVKVGTVHTWRRRGVIPEPALTVGQTPIWSRPEIERWAEATDRL